MRDIQSEGTKALNQAEHNADANAKRVISRVQGVDGDWANAPAPFIMAAHDYIDRTNPDGSGNYQTIAYYQGGAGGTIVQTLSLTYDGNNNVTSIART